MVAGVGIGRYEHWYGCGSSSNNSWGLQAIVSAVIDFVQGLFSRLVRPTNESNLISFQEKDVRVQLNTSLIADPITVERRLTPVEENEVIVQVSQLDIIAVTVKPSLTPVEERVLNELFDIDPEAEYIEELNYAQLRRLHYYASGFDMSNKMAIWFQRISLDENKNAYNVLIECCPADIRDELIDGLAGAKASAQTTTMETMSQIEAGIRKKAKKKIEEARKKKQLASEGGGQVHGQGKRELLEQERSIRFQDWIYQFKLRNSEEELTKSQNTLRREWNIKPRLTAREERGLNKLFCLNPEVRDIQELNFAQVRRLHYHASGFARRLHYHASGFDLFDKMKVWFHRISLDENQNAYNALIKCCPDDIRDELIKDLAKVKEQ